MKWWYISLIASIYLSSKTVISELKSKSDTLDLQVISKTCILRSDDFSNDRLGISGFVDVSNILQSNLMWKQNTLLDKNKSCLKNWKQIKNISGGEDDAGNAVFLHKWWLVMMMVRICRRRSWRWCVMLLHTDQADAFARHHLENIQQQQFYW